MSSSVAHYLPADRVRAVALGQQLPQTLEGSALFADISGFTPITERLRTILGARQGAEALASHLNRVYDALIAEVDRFGGSVIGFAGDAMTCWFDGSDAAVRSTACGFSLLATMREVETITLPDHTTLQLGLKVATSSGITRRLIVGNPDIQRIDVLAGATIARMAAGEASALRGELLVDTATLEGLGQTCTVREWRENSDGRFAVLEAPTDGMLFAKPALPDTAMLESPDELLYPWMLPALAQHFRAGLGEFQIELRSVTALFISFSGIDYDADTEAEDKLNAFIQLVQTVVHDYEGHVLQLTIGDKGSYLYATFGAPFTHEDDSARALNAALDIRERAADLAYLDPLQMGISRGLMRTGAYGGKTRRTYGVLGDEVNLAARLMSSAEPGTILVSESLLSANISGFELEGRPALTVKGKAQPIGVFRLTGYRDHSFEERFYTTPLVGRERELVQVLDALQPITEGRHGGVTYLYGEAGMGKSRVAFESRQQMQQGKAIMWLTGQTDNLNRAPYSAFAYFLRPYFGQRREQTPSANRKAFEAVFERLLAFADEGTRADLEVYGSYLAGIVGLVIPDSLYESADDRLRLENTIPAVKAWVRAQAHRQPLVLQLEDAHWLDAPSIRVIKALTYNMESVPLAVLLTSRYNDDGSPFTLSDIYSVPVHSIDLHQLNEDEMRTVVESVLGSSISDLVMRFVWERAAGNPLFVEQLALDLRERGALLQNNGQWYIQTGIASTVPVGITAILIARLDRLTTQVKAVVQTAAVLGREFDVRVLSRLLREDEQHYIHAAESEAIWTALDALHYLFRHVLLRDAAYEMQAQERLKTLHRLAAETIEQFYPDDPTQSDVLLEHWHRAGALDRELVYLEPVVKRHIDLTGQYQQAEKLLLRALDQLAPSDTRRIMVLKWLGRTCWRQQMLDRARQFTDEMLQLAEQVGDRAAIATGFVSFGMISFSSGDLTQAESYYQQAIVIFRELDDKASIAIMLGNLGVIAKQRGQYGQARALQEENLRVGLARGDARIIAFAYSSLANLALAEGNRSEAKALDQQSLAVARSVGDRGYIQLALLVLGGIAHSDGKSDEAIVYLDEALTIARELGVRERIGGVLNTLGIITTFSGVHDKARLYLREALSLWETERNRGSIATGLSNLGVNEFYAQDYIFAEDLHRQALAIRREIADIYVYFSLTYLTRTLLRQGRFEEGRRTLQEALALVRERIAAHKLFVLVAVIDWYRVQRRGEAAAALLGLILDHPNTDDNTPAPARLLLVEVQGEVEPEIFAVAMERGKKHDVDTVFTALEAELTDE